MLAGGPRGGDPADGSFRLPVSAVEEPAASGEVENAPTAFNSWLPLPTGDAVDPLRTLLLLLLGVKRLDPPRTSLLSFLTADPFCKRLPLD